MKQAIILLLGMMLSINSQAQTIPYLNSQAFKDTIWNFETEEAFSYTGQMPVIIEFTAEWCRPCKLMEPILENIQKKYAGNLQIYKVNDDREKEISDRFGIKYLPTLIFISPNSGKFHKTVGYKTERDLKKLIRKKFDLK